jgi:hypothetical protein
MSTAATSPYLRPAFARSSDQDNVAAHCCMSLHRRNLPPILAHQQLIHSLMPPRESIVLILRRAFVPLLDLLAPLQCP